MSTIRERAKTALDALTDKDISTLNIRGFDDDFGEWVGLQPTFIPDH